MVPHPAPQVVFAGGWNTCVPPKVAVLAPISSNACLIFSQVPSSFSRSIPPTKICGRRWWI
jgi:hypothetical protein